MDLEQKFIFFETHKKNHIGDHYVQPIPNMGVTVNKYGVSVNFCPELVIFGKTVGYHLWISRKNVKLFKTRKNSNTGPL
jgi:hypothetical protein